MGIPIQSFKSRGEELFKISMPMVVEQTGIALMGIVSTALVASVGEYAVSAVSMVDSIANLIIALFAALTTGGTIVVSQYLGRGDYEKAKNSAAQAILLSLFFAMFIFIVFMFFRVNIIDFLFKNADEIVIISANKFLFLTNFSIPILAITQTMFGILRGSKDTVTPMIISFVMNVINLLLGLVLIRGIDFWFVHVNGLGIVGAGISLLIARLIGMLLAAYVIGFKSRVLRLNRLTYFIRDKQIQKTILSFGIPTSVESSLFQAGRLITQIFIVGMGTAAMASNAIAGSIFGFINVPGNAFATGVMILVGQRIGQGKTEDIKPTTHFAVAMGTVFLSIICLITFIFTNQIIASYNPSPETFIQIKRIFYTGFIATPLFWGYSFIAPASLRACGDVKYTMVVSISTMWIVRIAFGYVLGVWLGFGVVGVWMGMYADWACRGAFFLKRILGNKWEHEAVV